MKNIIVNAGALAAVADAIEHEIMMMGFSDDETAADDWSFSGPRIRDAVDNLRKIIKAAPEQPAPGKSVVNLCHDASPEILKANADPAADAVSRFRQGREPEPDPSVFQPVRDACRNVPAGNGWEDVNQ